MNQNENSYELQHKSKPFDGVPKISFQNIPYRPGKNLKILELNLVDDSRESQGKSNAQIAEKEETKF